MSSITNRNTENLFSTFLLLLRGRCSLRGGCLRGCGSDVVHRAPLLTGLALAVVLGVTFALSTTALALGGGGGGGGSAPAPKIAKFADPVAKSATHHDDADEIRADLGVSIDF